MQNKLELPSRSDEIKIGAVDFIRKAALEQSDDELTILLSLDQLVGENYEASESQPDATVRIYIKEEDGFSLSDKHKALISFPDKIDNISHTLHLVENAPELVWDLLREFLSTEQITFWLTDLISDFDTDEPWLSDDDDTLEIDVPLSANEKVWRAQHLRNRVDVVIASEEKLGYQPFIFEGKIIAYFLDTQNPSASRDKA